MTGLDRITAKITADAKADADATLAAARAECDKIDADYAGRAAALRDSMLYDAEREISGMVARVKSTAAIERRNVVLGAKSELVDEAFALAMNDIRTMPPEKYRRLLTDILTSVVLNQSRAEEAELRDYGDSELESANTYEVVFNKADREAHGQAVIDTARINVSGKGATAAAEKLTLSDKTANIDGGIILILGDVTVNCSISMIFSRLREATETEVYRILFREKEQ